MAEMLIELVMAKWFDYSVVLLLRLMILIVMATIYSFQKNF
jgi:hypothetical protein